MCLWNGKKSYKDHNYKDEMLTALLLSYHFKHHIQFLFHYRLTKKMMMYKMKHNGRRSLFFFFYLKLIDIFILP